MIYDEAKQKIIEVVVRKLQTKKDAIEHYKLFYIGKTNNFDRRKDEHDKKSPFEDNSMPDVLRHNEMYQLAISKDTDKIKKLEADLINYFKTHNRFSDRCENELNGSVGPNKDSNCVYILFQRENNNREKEFESLYNDFLPLDEGMPFEID